MQQRLPFTVLKQLAPSPKAWEWRVATALTVYGIETIILIKEGGTVFDFRLQQRLPFTVLKHIFEPEYDIIGAESLLQQRLPFTVLKLSQGGSDHDTDKHLVATALTVYGIETDNLIF